MTTNVSQASGFAPLLELLNTHAIQYRLLRPSADDAESTELDLLVWPEQRAEFRRLAEKQGFRPLRLAAYKKEVLGRLSGGRIWYLDVHYALVQDGLIYQPLTDVDGRFAVTPDGYKCLSDEDLLLHLYFHNLIGKRGVQEKHQARIDELLQRPLDRDYLGRRFATAAQWELFSEFCDRPRQFSQGSPSAVRARASIVASLRGPGDAARSIGRWIARRLGGRRRGLQVAFMGVDGCGKSTTIEAVKQALRTARLRSDEVYMGPWGHGRSGALFAAKRFGFFPSGELWGLSRLTAHPAAALKKIVTGRIKGWVYYAAVYVEMWERFLVSVAPSVKRGTVVLSDRYIYDLRYIYKHRRMRDFALSRRLVCALFPKPHLVVFLHNDPDVIASRKGELTRDQIEEFQGLYALALRGTNVVSIKTDRGADQVAADIAGRISEVYFDRNLAR